MPGPLISCLHQWPDLQNRSHDIQDERDLGKWQSDRIIPERSGAVGQRCRGVQTVDQGVEYEFAIFLDQIVDVTKNATGTMSTCCKRPKKTIAGFIPHGCEQLYFNPLREFFAKVKPGRDENVEQNGLALAEWLFGEFFEMPERQGASSESLERNLVRS
jgi:hypothetical protein